MLGNSRKHKWMRCLGLCFLVMNIVLVSIPRCELIADLFWQHFVGHEADQKQTLSCHSSESQNKVHEGEILETQKRFCECFVFQFVAFDLPSLNWQDHVYFRIQTERILIFPSLQLLTDFLPPIEPPYPKV